MMILSTYPRVLSYINNFIKYFLPLLKLLKNFVCFWITWGIYLARYRQGSIFMVDLDLWYCLGCITYKDICLPIRFRGAKVTYNSITKPKSLTIWYQEIYILILLCGCNNVRALVYFYQLLVFCHFPFQNIFIFFFTFLKFLLNHNFMVFSKLIFLKGEL